MKTLQMITMTETIDANKNLLLSLFCAAGITEVTKANAKSFWQKIDGWQARYGSFFHPARMLTEADVLAHIGLGKRGPKAPQERENVTPRSSPASKTKARRR